MCIVCSFMVHFLFLTFCAQDIEEIKFAKGPGGLGFSIAGGTDDVGDDGDPSIYVTQV